MINDRGINFEQRRQSKYLGGLSVRRRSLFFRIRIPYEICIKRAPVTSGDRITSGSLQDRGLIKCGRLIKSNRPSLSARPDSPPPSTADIFCNNIGKRDFVSVPSHKLILDATVGNGKGEKGKRKKGRSKGMNLDS